MMHFILVFAITAALIFLFKSRRGPSVPPARRPAPQDFYKATWPQMSADPSQSSAERARAARWRR